VPGRYQPRGANDEPAQRLTVRSGANMGLLTVGNLGGPRVPGRFLPGYQLSTWTWTWRTWLRRWGYDHLLIEQRQARLLPGKHQPRGTTHQPTKRFPLCSRADMGIRQPGHLGGPRLPGRLCHHAAINRFGAGVSSKKTTAPTGTTTDSSRSPGTGLAAGLARIRVRAFGLGCSFGHVGAGLGGAVVLGPVAVVHLGGGV
jgi:hypothetical protein